MLDNVEARRRLRSSIGNFTGNSPLSAAVCILPQKNRAPGKSAVVNGCVRNRLRFFLRFLGSVARAFAALAAGLAFFFLGVGRLSGAGKQDRSKTEGEEDAEEFHTIWIGWGWWPKKGRSSVLRADPAFSAKTSEVPLLRPRFSLVPRVGVEPTLLSEQDFESSASANFAIWAHLTRS
jgi:hypothetical protein